MNKHMTHSNKQIKDDQKYQKRGCINNQLVAFTVLVAHYIVSKY